MASWYLVCCFLFLTFSNCEQRNVNRSEVDDVEFEDIDDWNQFYTATVTSTTTKTKFIKAFTFCAVLVNVTGPCRSRYRVSRWFNGDSIIITPEEVLNPNDQIFHPGAVQPVEVTAKPQASPRNLNRMKDVFHSNFKSVINPSMKLLNKRIALPELKSFDLLHFLAGLNPFRSAATSSSQSSASIERSSSPTLESRSSVQTLKSSVPASSSIVPSSSIKSTSTEASATPVLSRLPSSSSSSNSSSVPPAPLSSRKSESFTALAREDHLTEPTVNMREYTLVKTVTYVIHQTAITTSWIEKCTREPFTHKICNSESLNN